MYICGDSVQTIACLLDPLIYYQQDWRWKYLKLLQRLVLYKQDPFIQPADHFSARWKNLRMPLKAVDTIGNCKRLAFTVGVSQHMHKITNMWKFELNRSSKLRDSNERKKHPCHTKLCAFRWLISRPQVLQIRGKLLLSRKLWHFRGSRFSQCFIPSTSPH